MFISSQTHPQIFNEGSFKLFYHSNSLPMTNFRTFQTFFWDWMSACGVNHPDSNLAEVGKLSAQKALGHLDGSAYFEQLQKFFKVVRGAFPSLLKVRGKRVFPQRQTYVWDVKKKLWWWRWRRNVSFSISASLSLFSALTLYSHAHLWSIKLSMKLFPFF